MNRKNTLILWIIYIAIVVVTKFNTEPTPGNVYNVYFLAGKNWLASNSIFESGRFLYYPFTAIFFSPFSLLPFNIGGALFRSINILIFAYGIFYFTKNEKEFFISSIVSIALSWAAAKHGQATLSMAGFMLVTCRALENKKLLTAGAFLALSTITKPLSIVLLLLVLALYPKVIPNTLIFILVLISVSFLTQDYTYILKQLNDYPEVIKAAVARSTETKFLHIFSLLELIQINFNNFAQTCTRLMFAFTTLATLVITKKHNYKNFAFLLYTLSTSYILLFGAGTEKNTYSLFAPVLGLVIYKFIESKNYRLLGLSLVLNLVWITSHSAYKSLSINLLFYTKPICTIVLTLIILGISLKDSFKKSL